MLRNFRLQVMIVTQLSALRGQVVLMNVRALRCFFIPPYPRHLLLNILGQMQAHGFLERVADRFLRLLLLLSGSGYFLFLGTLGRFHIIFLRCLQVLVVVLDGGKGSKFEIARIGTYVIWLKELVGAYDKLAELGIDLVAPES